VWREIKVDGHKGEKKGMENWSHIECDDEGGRARRNKIIVDYIFFINNNKGNMQHAPEWNYCKKADINACNDRCIKSIMRNKLILNTLRRDKFDISRPRRFNREKFLPSCNFFRFFLSARFEE
jgi:hypothetical protein